ncbi:hypothetical protein OROHE_015063 [Orobanche hederae]
MMFNGLSLAKNSLLFMDVSLFSFFWRQCLISSISVAWEI